MGHHLEGYLWNIPSYVRVFLGKCSKAPTSGDINSEYTLWLFVTQPWYRWPIEIDGLPSYKMVDLSMAKC